jgi:hypothetical protein
MRRAAVAELDVDAVTAAYDLGTMALLAVRKHARAADLDRSYEHSL